MMIAMNALIFLMMIISTKSHIPVFISDPFSVTAVDGSTVEFTCTANDTEDIIYRVNSTSAELPDIKDKGFIQLYPEKLDSLLLRRNLSVTVSSAYSNTEIFCKAIGTGPERNENSDIAILTVQVLTPPTKPTRDNMVLIVATSISAEVFIMIVFITITVLVLLWGYMKKRRTNSINTSPSGSTDIPEQISDDDEQGDDDTPKAPLLNGKAKEENGLIRDDKDVEEDGPVECSSNESSDSHHSCVEESKT